MNNKKIKKGSQILKLLNFNIESSNNKFQDGIIYTLYSVEFNSLIVGFANNHRVLQNQLSSEALILLDKKSGSKKELILLLNTLRELGIEYSDDHNFKYSNFLMRHLSTLGWPVGRSLYKQRKIKKELQYA